MGFKFNKTCYNCIHYNSKEDHCTKDGVDYQAWRLNQYVCCELKPDLIEKERNYDVQQQLRSELHSLSDGI